MKRCVTTERVAGCAHTRAHSRASVGSRAQGHVEVGRSGEKVVLSEDSEREERAHFGAETIVCKAGGSRGEKEGGRGGLAGRG